MIDSIYVELIPRRKDQNKEKASNNIKEFFLFEWNEKGMTNKETLMKNIKDKAFDFDVQFTNYR